MKVPIAAAVKFSLLLCLVAFGNTHGYAEIVDTQWAGGAFSHKATIAPKKFLEACGKLKIGEVVSWHFNAAAPTDFNIHYHVGKDVVYPEQRKETSRADGILSVPLDQHYCWMWTNRTPHPLDIDISLKQLKAGK